MKVRLILLFTLSLFCYGSSSYAQQMYYVVTNNGLWSQASTWNTAADGSGISAVPTSADYVRTNGLTVIVDADVSVRRLFVAYNVANSIIYDDNSFDPLTVTVTEFLAGYSYPSTGAAKPTTAVIGNHSDLYFKFTGAAGSTVIRNWSISAPLPNVVIAGSGTLTTQDNSAGGVNGGEFIVRYSLNLQTGTFQPENIGSTGTPTFNVATGATLDLSFGSLVGSDGTGNSRFNSISISGTVNVSGAEFLNANNLTLQSSGTLNVNSSGANQTQGWWYQSTAPTGLITLNGTVTYGAGTNQTIATKTYSTLTLSGSGTKAASSGSSLIVNGALTIGSGVTFDSESASGVILKGNVTNYGSWSPTQRIKFEGTGTQVFSGNPVVFSGGIDVGNASTTPSTILDLADNLDVDAELRIFANATLDLNDNTLILAGNLSNSGNLIDDGSGLAKITFDGTTSVSGATAASFPNVLVSGTFNSPSTLTITRDLTINSGGTHNAGSVTNLAGNFSSQGTFNAGSGTVNFNGTSSQSLSGTATFNNITVSNANTVTAVGTIGLAGTFTLSGSGKFNAGTGANFTVLSTGLNSGGSIGSLGTPTNFSGQVTIQRFIDAPADWRFLSIPVKNADVGDLADDITVTGFSGQTCTADGVRIFNCAEASIYEFTSSGWVGLTGTTYDSKPLSSLKGYNIWSYLTANTTLDVTGEIEKGNVVINGLNSSAGSYSLIPNPYPSAIDWDVIANTGFSNNIYLTTAEGSYATYTKGSNIGVNHPDGSWPGYVAMGQSFWIQSSGGNSSLTMTEAAKVSTYEFVREAAPKDYFKMQLRSSQHTDELAIVFRNNATNSNDPEFDAIKRPNDWMLNFSSYTADPDTNYAINAIAPIQCSETIRLKVSDVSAGQHTITFSDLEKLELGYELILIDKFLSIEKKISTGTSYTFDITADMATYGADRFELKINSPLIDVTRDLQLTSLQECDKEFVRLEINNTQHGIQYLFKSGDETLHEPVAGNGGVSYAFVSKTLFNQGLNALALVASSVDGCNAHIFNDAISVRIDAIDEITSVTPGQNCGEGQVTLSASGASADGSYKWYVSENASEPIAGASLPTFLTPSLAATTTFYVSAVNASGCESTLRVPVEGRIVEIEKPEITADGHYLLVSAKTGIQWYKDGSAIEGATSPDYSVKNTGKYSVSVAKDGCTAFSDGFEFIVNGPESKNAIHGFSLSPNPTSDVLYVNGPSFSGVSVYLYDTRGRQLNIEGVPVSESQISFNLAGTKNGLYLVNIESQHKLIQLKAIKK